MRKSTAKIRQLFLDFFHRKGHQVISSSSLVPSNDQTLLFTNAGMNQFKDVFLGLDKRNYSCATTSQRCVRAGGKHNDLENVGYTARHHTFFEMLGNFSFGAYFKHEAIQYAWELLTAKNWFNLSKKRLWVTVYETDYETYEIWEKEIGISRERIIRVGDNRGAPYASDNFWQMGDMGACGPCTEIFYDHGDHIWGGPPGSTNADGDRYIEIWNIVFVQFNRQENGIMEPLLKPFVDTGMGLERIAAVLQNVHSNYEIDLFRMLIEEIAKIIGTIDLKNKSLYVIADHIRSSAFLIADGVIPSNDSRGYVLRRIIRRAVRYGKMLGAKEAFFYRLVEPLISVMGVAGEELKRQRMQVEKILKIEEEQFSRTLDRGLILLNKEIEKLQDNTLDGKTVFRLYDTYGFPVDLLIDICRELNIKVDEVGFKAEMERQRNRARESSTFKIHYNSEIRFDSITKFEGYSCLKVNSTVIALFVNNKSVKSISTGQDAVIILDKTPFYAESGGQIGDTGKIKNNNFHFAVSNTQKYGLAIGHIGKLIFGSLKVGKNVYAQVDETRRMRICLNHTATHLVHASLREILGSHILQKGSLVTDKMLRFDFSHFNTMKLSEIYEVENLVNKQIRLNLPIEIKIMDLNSAREKGAISLFREQYEKYVRVLSIGDFSTELCGGTHTVRTGDIGLFRILNESSAGFGIRRIKAATGEEAIADLHVQNNQMHEIAQLLKGNSYNLNEKVQNILKRIHQLEKDLHKMQKKMLEQKSENLSRKIIEVKNTKLLVSELSEVNPGMLRTITEHLKNQLSSLIIVLATIIKNKIFLVAGVSKDITNRVTAEELISMVAKQVRGKGGGSKDIAQAIGIDIAALPTALTSIKSWINKKL